MNDLERIKAEQALERRARRVVSAEDGRALAAAVRIARTVAGMGPGEVFVLPKDGTEGLFAVIGALEDVAKLEIQDARTGKILHNEEKKKRKGEDALRLVMVRKEAPAVLADLRNPTEEDVARLRDLVSLREGAALEDLRVLAPSADPAEASDWVDLLMKVAGASFSLGSISLNQEWDTTPEFPLVIDTFGGNCPVQAEGEIGETTFYYRARGEKQSFESGDGFFMMEVVPGGRYVAGWIPEGAAREFMDRAGLAYARWKADQAEKA